AMGGVYGTSTRVPPAAGGALPPGDAHRHGGHPAGHQRRGTVYGLRALRAHGGALRAARQALRRNWRLFIPVILGGGVGFLLLARAVELLLTVAAVETTALFTGLICGTIPGLMKKSGSKVARMGDPGWAGFVISLMLSF